MSEPPPQGWCFIDEEAQSFAFKNLQAKTATATARGFLKNLRKVTAMAAARYFPENLGK